MNLNQPHPTNLVADIPNCLEVFMNKKRFYYTRSTIYGWCVYDRQTQTPAYEACAELLPPLYSGEDGTTYVSPICYVDGEYRAMRLCTRLNMAWKRYCQGNNQ